MKALTTEKFIKKAKVIHGDKYDYSVDNYINNRTKMKIRCKVHGVFEQNPYNHLSGRGCPKCGIIRRCNKQKSNIDDFIKRATIIHSEKYDYSPTDYINALTKVEIRCKIHGIFEQTPNQHLRGNGCPKCAIISISDKLRSNKDDFIKKAKEIHSDKYDYSPTKYINALTKVEIRCKIHGIFEQTPNQHLRGNGCPKCAIITSSSKLKSNKEDFIEKAKIIHDDKYDYLLIDYINSKINIKIICKEHGVFEQTPGNHLSGNGCPKCANKIRNIDKLSNTKDFIKKSIFIHGDKYDYSPTKYINSLTKVDIICKEHGVFEQNLYNHLSGNGCPKCNSSKGEIKVAKYLSDNNINYIEQYKFNDCKNKKPLPFDFYLPNHNMCIEYDGRQHFIPIKRFGGDKALERTKKHDDIKSKYCTDNNIQLIRIHYEDYDNIGNILNNYIK